ncbi:hypothetical protein SPI_01379 [Niveomyces insectorum RCEF 264]|uniref:Uncharacterized protein n=1 Tax=Niveomyces insectorum RCEF 264 TaxID=1081102 RepID=A0A167YX63_9HYPO|nr:hypothetical protein SPI_01379 [Niveomyces insectorum RCEF 264]
MSVRQSTQTLLALFAVSTAASVLAPRANTAPPPWVSIDAGGVASTVTPAVDKSTTVGAPPSYLTHTAAYVLSVDHSGRPSATTSTGTPPVVTATGPGPAGAVLACANIQGTLAPFCQPQAGSELVPGHTYYITWDPAYFAAGVTIDIETQYANNVGSLEAAVPAREGVYAWTVTPTVLAEQNATALNVSLYLSYAETVNGAPEAMRVVGPTVTVTKTLSSAVPVPPTAKRVSALAIALPVVLGLAALSLLLGFCAWSYRHHGRLPCIGGLVSKRTSSFSAKGYGVREDYYGRQRRSGGGGVKPALTTTVEAVDETAGSKGPTNVFREELRRQEQQQQEGW